MLNNPGHILKLRWSPVTSTNFESDELNFKPFYCVLYINSPYSLIFRTVSTVFIFLKIVIILLLGQCMKVFVFFLNHYTPFHHSILLLVLYFIRKLDNMDTMNLRFGKSGRKMLQHWKFQTIHLTPSRVIIRSSQTNLAQ